MDVKRTRLYFTPIKAYLNTHEEHYTFIKGILETGTPLSLLKWV